MTHPGEMPSEARDPMADKYRSNAGAILRRNDGQILMCHKVNGGDYPWQFPQGGVHCEESVEQAMWREISEELGLENPRELCRLVDRGPPVCYPFSEPKGEYVGQRQTLFVLDFLGSESQFDLDHERNPEFDAFRWVTLEASLELLVPAKRPVLRRTIDAV